MHATAVNLLRAPAIAANHTEPATPSKLFGNTDSAMLSSQDLNPFTTGLLFRFRSGSQ
jgi:hypothetical protein